MNTTNAPQFFLSISVNLPYDISITYKKFEEAEIVTFVSIVLGLALLLLNQIAAADLVKFHDPTASMGISFECGTSIPQHSQFSIIALAPLFKAHFGRLTLPIQLSLFLLKIRLCRVCLLL